MPYQRVVVALDVFTDAAATVMQRARFFCRDAEATAVYVVDENPLQWGDQLALGGVTGWRDEVEAQASHRLRALSSDLDHHLLLKGGHAASEIRHCAEDRGADLVVIGAHGRHGWRLLLGSTANALLHEATCDVLCVHVPGDVRPFDEVLVAIDGSKEDARVVMERGVEVAELSQARVSVISVVPPLQHAYASALYADVSAQLNREAQERANATVDTLADEFAVTGQRLVRHGYPGPEIHAARDELSADLVVVGSHGRHGFTLLLGSTANAVLHGARSDVLAVRLGR